MDVFDRYNGVTLDGQMSIFDFDTKEQFKFTKPIRMVELFAGIGATAMAMRDLGVNFEHHRVVEFDKYAMASYNAIHGTNFEPTDVRNVRGGDLGITNTDKYDYVLTYSFP